MIHAETPGEKKKIKMRKMMDRILPHLMRYRGLHFLPINADISQGDYEEGAPEDEVGQGDDHKHL